VNLRRAVASRREHRTLSRHPALWIDGSCLSARLAMRLNEPRIECLADGPHAECGPSVGARQSTCGANGMSSSMSPPARGKYPPPLLSVRGAPRSALFALDSIVIWPLKRASTISVE
jgi:hypothetical protein